ncbi:MAG: ATP-binding protein [Candidatus Margulisiibacteriota bacterium]
MLDDLILHDLKNPLSGITGSIGLFLDDTLGPINAEQKKYLENINFSAKKLALLLLELSFINNAEKGDLAVAKSAFPAGELLKELTWLRRLAEKESKTIKENVDGNLSVRADKELTVMIIADLLLNAVKQAERGGAVTLNLKQEKDHFMFEIIHPGEGVPKEYAAKIFNKNFRAENPQLKAKTSPGLGFYFCKLAVEAQGGSISVESTVGQGSRFYFYLPRA